ncbi:hypothetical protein [Frankia sp. CcI49]|nr:hypothetical protein [Frankia sp. CcI49]
MDLAFLGAVAALVMAAIQQGQLRTLTGFDDAAAYRALVGLQIAGTSDR